MLDAVIEYMPAPVDVEAIKGHLEDDVTEVVRIASDDAPFSALAFKIAADPFVGTLTFFRVYSGELNSGDSVYNSVKKKKERIGRIVQMHANSREEVKKVCAGDIAAAIGLKYVTTGDTLCDLNEIIVLERMEFPDPVISMSIEPKTKVDQEKMGVALQRLAEEDPTFRVHTDEDTVVPAENPVSFYLACRKHKVPAELHIYRPGPHGVGLYLGDPVLGTWSGHLRDWLRNQGFLKPAKRTAIDGKVTVNGKPVSWGSVIFTPEDPSAPVACARVMGGKFKLDEKTGPVLGKVKLTVSYSAADVPGLETADGTVTTKEQKPGAGDWNIEIGENEKNLELQVSR